MSKTLCFILSTTNNNNNEKKRKSEKVTLEKYFQANRKMK
jgi:hypothetical protein